MVAESRLPYTKLLVALSRARAKGVYTCAMAKRASQDIKRKKSRSRKTKKRLEAKRKMLEAKGYKW